jgi:large repetitive protein
MRRLLLIPLLALATLDAQAALITVNALGDLPDADPADGVCNADPGNPVPQCTLRAAVQTANALPGHDTIVLAPGGIYQLNQVGGGGAAAGDLNLTDDVDIVGFVGAPPAELGALPLIEASGLNNRIFVVHGDVEVTLRGLRLQGGNAGIGSGGAIAGVGRLTVEHVDFRFNRANRGGAISLESGDSIDDIPAPPASLTVRDSHFERNDAILEGGAIYSQSTTLTIERSSFRDNRGAAANGSTLYVGGNAATIVDSSFDGTSLGGPIAGLAPSIGIQAHSVNNLVLRNLTVGGFSLHALDLVNLSGARRARIGNSILAGGVAACRASGPAVADADIVIAHSLVQAHIDCGQFYADVIAVAPQLGAIANDPGRLTWSRPPSGPLSNLVDAGIAPGVVPASPELACTAFDQRGNPRPQDGNGDDIARCDIGAVEEGELLTFVVDAAGDAVDDAPGDGLCETLSFECTLRAAVMEANALPGLQRIRFAPGIDLLPLILPPHPSAAGGDLDLSEGLIISGNTSGGLPVTTIVQQVAGERLFDVAAAFNGPITLRNLRLTGGDSGPAFGGAVRQLGGQLTIDNSELFGNRAFDIGGAIAVQGGNLSLLRSDLYDNSASFLGSALFVGAGGVASVLRSSVWLHTDVNAAATEAVAAVVVDSNATLRLSSSTIANNSGGLLTEFPAALLIAGSTIAGNGSTGIWALFDAASQVGIHGSIIAGNGASGLDMSGLPAADCQIDGLAVAALAGYDHLLDSDGSCGFGTATVLTAADPLLQPLAPLGGHAGRAMRPRYAPAQAEVSPAIDVAPAATCLPSDQGGAARGIDLPDVADVDGPCDLGAIELRLAVFRDGFEPASP